MPKHVADAYILTCNISMEYEKSEVNSSFYVLGRGAKREDGRGGEEVY